MCIVYVFARLDVRSLTRLLSTCKSLRDEFFVHDVEEQTAWRGLVDTKLPQQIAFLKACELDLKRVLHPENLRAYVTAFCEDDSQRYFEVVDNYASHDRRAHSTLSVSALLFRRDAYRRSRSSDPEDLQRHPGTGAGGLGAASTGAAPSVGFGAQAASVPTGAGVGGQDDDAAAQA
jgi:hypothetical protein